MPGIGEEIEGAMQQAPQPERQSMDREEKDAGRRTGKQAARSRAPSRDREVASPTTMRRQRATAMRRLCLRLSNQSG
jgi:hypothetical protein